MARRARVAILAAALAVATAGSGCRTAPADPPRPDLLSLGRTLERTGRELAALDAYRAAVLADPSRLEAHLAYQDLALRRGERPHLEQEYARARARSARADDWLRARLRPDESALPDLIRLAAGGDVVAGRSGVDLARLHLRAGRRAEALEAARRAVELLPGDPDPRMGLAEAEEALGLYAAALASYDAALARGSPAARAQAGRARVLLAGGRPGEADRALQAVPPDERGDATFQRARSAAAAALGRPVEVEVALEKALEADPGDPRTRRSLGLLLVAAGRDPERTRFILGPLAGPESRDVEVLVASGRLDLRAGEAGTAADKLARAVGLGAGPDVRRDLLEARVAAGRFEEAADVEVESDPAALARRAEARRALGRTREAEADLRAALALDPAADAAAADLALLLAADGRADEGLALLRDRGDSARAAAARGRILLDRGDVEGAGAALRDAVARGTDDAAAYLDLAELARRDRLPEDRARWLRAGIAARPGDADLVLALALALGPTPEAEGLLHGLLRRRPAIPAARVALAQILLARGAVEEAFRLAIRAVEDRPGDAGARAVLGDAYAAAGRPDEAERSYDLALGRDPRCSVALLGRARLLARLGPERADEALLACRAALDRDPWSVEARLGLARQAQARGRPEETEAALAPLVGEDRPDADALDLLARAREAAERPAEAIDALRRLLGLRPRDAAVHLRLGRLYEATGRDDLALYHDRQALRWGADEATVAPHIRRILERR